MNPIPSPDECSDIFAAQQKRSTYLKERAEIRSKRGFKKQCSRCGDQKRVTNPETGGMMPCPKCHNRKTEVKL